MKRSLLAAFAALSLFATPALADTTVGVVNLGRIMKEAKVMTSVRSQVQTKQKSLQAEADSKLKALQAEDQALVKQKDSADKAAFDKKVKEFQQKAASEQRSVQDRRIAVEKAYTAALEEVQKNLQEIVKQIATEKKLTLVVSSATVLYGDESLDLTAEALKRLDSKLPTLSVKF